MPVPRRLAGEPLAFEAWCQREMSRLLGFPVGDDLVSYLLSMDTVKDTEEYLTELLGRTTPGAREFQREFLTRWHPPERLPSSPSLEERDLLEQLVRLQQDKMVLFESGGKGETKRKGGSGALPAPPGFSTIPSKVASSDSLSSKLPSKSESLTEKSGPGGGREGGSGGKTTKPKFVPLMSAEGKSRVAMHLPGRHACQCLAQKHALVNNCLECGRIVCAQEGSGPCLFCGALVCTSEEEEVLARNSKKGLKMREKLVKQFQLKEGDRAFDHLQSVGTSGSGRLQVAVQHKEKLLEFDQTSAHRTRVIDDERDYFAVDSNRWVSQDDRDSLRQKEEELRDAKYGSRRNKALTLDFAGRKVVEEEQQLELYDEEHTKGLANRKTDRHKETVTHGNNDGQGLCNPTITVEPPKFQPLNGHRKKNAWSRCKREEEEEEGLRSAIVRLQDRNLQEMADEGKCLSMHQPWASLLVSGVKRFEGRTWYTTHRGRLWIAAAAKEPEPGDVSTTEEFYRRLYGGKVKFPSDYPTGCLLGCVDVADCLPQEDYVEKFPAGESDSPYVFVCENPQELVVKFPLKGKHKIWKLPKDVHAAAKRGCRPSQVHQHEL